MQTYVLNRDTIPEIIDWGPMCSGIPTKIHKEFCYRLHIWKNWTKTFKNAIDKMKWRPQKALFSTCQLFWSEFCQRSKAIYFLRSEQTVSAFYISIQNMDRNLFEKRTSICLFISILFQVFYFTWILSISKIDDIFFLNPEFFPLLEIVAKAIETGMILSIMDMKKNLLCLFFIDL